MRRNRTRTRHLPTSGRGADDTDDVGGRFPGTTRPTSRTATSWDRIRRTVQADADAAGRIDWSVASMGFHLPSRPPTRRRSAQEAATSDGERRTPRKHLPDEGLGPSGADCHKRKSEIERTMNRLKNLRAVAARYDKRACVFHGSVTVAAIRLWLRP